MAGYSYVLTSPYTVPIHTSRGIVFLSEREYGMIACGFAQNVGEAEQLFYLKLETKH